MSRLTIEWLLADGRGAGRAESGEVIRVAGAVPGDVVDAHTGEVVVPSPSRRQAPCPLASACGGCDLGHLSSEARTAALARTVAHAFRVDADPPVVPSPRAEGHRARIKLALDGGRVSYRRARSHELVDVDVCRIARPEVQAAHARLREWAAAGTEGLASVELRSDGARVVHAFTSAGAVPRAVRDRLGDLGDVALDGRTVAGDPVLTLSVDGLALRAGPRAFYQVNLEQNAQLVAHVRDAVLARRPERVLDLYAGIGNLSFPIAARVPVVAVEAPGPGAADLRHNAGVLPGVDAVACRVERFDPSRVAFDAVVLDPPRAGAPGVLRRLARNRPRVVVYVSCHAPSAARDVKELDGYRLVDLTCFDLFPDTHHVEAVAVLERG